MADITVNATGAPQIYTTATGSPLTDTSLTAIAGSNIGVVVTVTCRTMDLPSIAMTANGSAMTLLNSQKQASWEEYCYIFGRLGISGAQTLVLTWTGGATAQITFCAVASNNVSSFSAVLTNVSNTSATPDGNITSEPGDATVSILSHSGSTTLPDTDHVTLFNDSNHGSSQYKLSTGTPDRHRYTMASSTWGLAGVRLLHVSDVVTQTFVPGRKLAGLIYT